MLILTCFFYSQSSDYYSSGENRLPGGVLTPPTAGPVCLSIPRNVMQNQYKFCSYLSQCHELWEQADLFVARGEGKGARGTCEGNTISGVIILYPGRGQGGQGHM